MISRRLIVVGGGYAEYAEINRKQAAKMGGEAVERARTVARNISLISNDQKPRFTHVTNYTTDFPKVFLSLGEGKAMLTFRPYYVSTGAAEYLLKKRVDVDEIMGRFAQ